MKNIALVIITAILMASCSPTVQCRYVKDKRKSGIHNTALEKSFLKRPKALKVKKQKQQPRMRHVAVPCFSFN